MRTETFKLKKKIDLFNLHRYLTKLLCFRDQMNLPGGKTEKVHEQKVIPNSNRIMEKENKGLIGGCCQRSNSVSYCEEENPKPKPIKKEGKCTK